MLEVPTEGWWWWLAIPKRKVVFERSIFRCYVSSLEGRFAGDLAYSFLFCVWASLSRWCSSYLCWHSGVRDVSQAPRVSFRFRFQSLFGNRDRNGSFLQKLIDLIARLHPTKNNGIWLFPFLGWAQLGRFNFNLVHNLRLIFLMHNFLCKFIQISQIFGMFPEFFLDFPYISSHFPLFFSIFPRKTYQSPPSSTSRGSASCYPYLGTTPGLVG